VRLKKRGRSRSHLATQDVRSVEDVATEKAAPPLSVALAEAKSSQVEAAPPTYVCVPTSATSAVHPWTLLAKANAPPTISQHSRRQLNLDSVERMPTIGGRFE